MPELIDLPYCPHCGKPTFKSGRFKPWSCKSCGFEYYPNIASAAAVFVHDDQGRILFTERAHDPGKGKLGLPGGFLDAGETAESGVRREVMEEVGLKVTKLTYLLSLPNEYYYAGVCYDTIDLFFSAQVTPNPITMDPTEVIRVHWKTPVDIQKDDLAFPSYYEALKSLEGFDR